MTTPSTSSTPAPGRTDRAQRLNTAGAPQHSPRSALGLLSATCTALAAGALLSACIVEPLPGPRYVPPPRPAPVYVQPAPVYPQPAPVYAQPAPVYTQAPYEPAEEEPVVSVYIDPPTYQPEPIAVSWAPPPMLVEVPPPQPYPDAIWTGGYWAWQGRWVWAAGRWSEPPQPRYVWCQPYYEHRGEVVIFVPGFWSPPQARFVPPPPGISITLAVGIGGYAGHRPLGPQGIFVPPPPGSRAGIIVPAPMGTPPAVVVSAPPVVNVGMRVHGNVDVNDHRVTNNVTNITNVTIEAPPGATANGRPFQGSVPARSHLAASLPAIVHAQAPVPVSGRPIPSYVPGRPPAALPAPQALRGERSERGGRGDSPQGQPQQQPWQAQNPQPQQQQQQQRPGTDNTAGRPDFA